MSRSLSHVCILGCIPKYALDELGISTVSPWKGWLPNVVYSAFDLNNGWSLIICKHSSASKLVEDEFLTSLSKDCEVIACAAEEHCMESRCEGWKDSECIWQIYHNNFVSRAHLAEWGVLPKQFEEIKQAAIQEQLSDGTEEDEFHFDDDETDEVGNRIADEVNMFDVPIDLVANLTGYHYAKVKLVLDDGVHLF